MAQCLQAFLPPFVLSVLACAIPAAAAVVFAVLHPVWAASALLLGAAATGWVAVVVWGRHTVTADVAAHLLYSRSHGKSPGLPDSLRGVFWMSDNPAPELLASLDGSRFDEGKRTLSLTLSGPGSWSNSSDTCGFFGWFSFAVLGCICCGRGRFTFNQDFTEGRIDIPLCGCLDVYALAGVKMTMRDATPQGAEPGTTWLRQTTVCGLKLDSGTYTLRKVIGAGGEKVQPNFDAMLATLRSDDNPGVYIKGWSGKPLQQIVSGSRWPFCGGDVEGAPVQEAMGA